MGELSRAVIWRAGCNQARAKRGKGLRWRERDEMKRRSMGLGLVAGLAVLAGAFAAGCSSAGGSNGGDDTELGRGTLQLPLLTEGPSGTSYRLRNATFEVVSYSYYYGYSSSAGGE